MSCVEFEGAPELRYDTTVAATALFEAPGRLPGQEMESLIRGKV
jgi:hypothetical protein